MATINKNYNKLAGNYLFSEIAKRTKEFLDKNPGVEIMRLGIGDTTEPLTNSVMKGLRDGVEKLGSAKTYTGYGPSEGNLNLRAALAGYYKKRGVTLEVDEIFISDGAKSDSANIQSIFGKENTVAVQDPSYTVYVDSNVIAGRTGEFKDWRYENLVYLECNEKNNFVPSLPKGKVDLMYLCSPNNPTGVVFTKDQLKTFVDYALKNSSVIIFDAAYSEYIGGDSLPRSIYEVEGARKCAIEINSFSKSIGFTGVRLGWTVVPKDLITEEKIPGLVNNLWRRRQNTMFNGASNISQDGALASLSREGEKEARNLISFYMDNATLIKNNLSKMGFKVFGGENAPYIWAKIPSRISSWEFFDKLLQEAHVVATPGSGFGRQGEGYMRFSAFSKRNTIEKAMKSIKENLKL